VVRASALTMESILDIPYVKLTFHFDMKNQSKYVWKLVIGLGLYVLGLVALNLLEKPLSNYKYILFLLPVLPLVYWAGTFVRYVLAMDEMLRKVLIEGMAFAGLATAFTCFSLLFVRDLGGMKFPGEAGFYIYWFYYALGTSLSARRYR